MSKRWKAQQLLLQGPSVPWVAPVTDVLCHGIAADTAGAPLRGLFWTSWLQAGSWESSVRRRGRPWWFPAWAMTVIPSWGGKEAVPRQAERPWVLWGADGAAEDSQVPLLPFSLWITHRKAELFNIVHAAKFGISAWWPLAPTWKIFMVLEGKWHLRRGPGAQGGWKLVANWVRTIRNCPFWRTQPCLSCTFISFC